MSDRILPSFASQVNPYLAYVNVQFNSQFGFPNPLAPVAPIGIFSYPGDPAYSYITGYPQYVQYPLTLPQALGNLLNPYSAYPYTTTYENFLLKRQDVIMATANSVFSLAGAAGAYGIVRIPGLSQAVGKGLLLPFGIKSQFLAGLVGPVATYIGALELGNSLVFEPMGRAYGGADLIRRTLTPVAFGSPYFEPLEGSLSIAKSYDIYRDLLKIPVKDLTIDYQDVQAILTTGMATGLYEQLGHNIDAIVKSVKTISSFLRLASEIARDPSFADTIRNMSALTQLGYSVNTVAGDYLRLATTATAGGQQLFQILPKALEIGSAYMRFGLPGKAGVETFINTLPLTHGLSETMNKLGLTPYYSLYGGSEGMATIQSMQLAANFNNPIFQLLYIGGGGYLSPVLKSISPREYFKFAVRKPEEMLNLLETSGNNPFMINLLYAQRLLGLTGLAGRSPEEKAFALQAMGIDPMTAMFATDGRFQEALIYGMASGKFQTVQADVMEALNRSLMYRYQESLLGRISGFFRWAYSGISSFMSHPIQSVHESLIRFFNQHYVTTPAEQNIIAKFILGPAAGPDRLSLPQASQIEEIEEMKYKKLKNIPELLKEFGIEINPLEKYKKLAESFSESNKIEDLPPLEELFKNPPKALPRFNNDVELAIVDTMHSLITSNKNIKSKEEFVAEIKSRIGRDLTKDEIKNLETIAPMVMDPTKRKDIFKEYYFDLRQKLNKDQTIQSKFIPDEYFYDVPYSTLIMSEFRNKENIESYLKEGSEKINKTVQDILLKSKNPDAAQKYWSVVENIIADKTISTEEKLNKISQYLKPIGRLLPQTDYALLERNALLKLAMVEKPEEITKYMTREYNKLFNIESIHEKTEQFNFGSIKIYEDPHFNPFKIKDLEKEIREHVSKSSLVKDVEGTTKWYVSQIESIIKDPTIPTHEKIKKLEELNKSKLHMKSEKFRDLIRSQILLEHPYLVSLDIYGIDKKLEQRILTNPNSVKREILSKDLNLNIFQKEIGGKDPKQVLMDLELPESDRDKLLALIETKLDVIEKYFKNPRFPDMIGFQKSKEAKILEESKKWKFETKEAEALAKQIREGIQDKKQLSDIVTLILTSNRKTLPDFEAKAKVIKDIELNLLSNFTGIRDPEKLEELYSAMSIEERKNLIVNFGKLNDREILERTKNQISQIVQRSQLDEQTKKTAAKNIEQINEKNVTDKITQPTLRQTAANAQTSIEREVIGGFREFVVTLGKANTELDKFVKLLQEANKNLEKPSMPLINRLFN